MSIQSIEPQISQGIVKTTGVSGGVACIAHTRIPVWTLENYRRLGWMESAILENFPSLSAVDLVNARAYADAHQEELDQSIHANEEAW